MNAESFAIAGTLGDLSMAAWLFGGTGEALLTAGPFIAAASFFSADLAGICSAFAERDSAEADDANCACTNI